MATVVAAVLGGAAAVAAGGALVRRWRSLAGLEPLPTESSAHFFISHDGRAGSETDVALLAKLMLARGFKVRFNAGSRNAAASGGAGVSEGKGQEPTMGTRKRPNVARSWTALTRKSWTARRARRRIRKSAVFVLFLSDDVPRRGEMTAELDIAIDSNLPICFLHNPGFDLTSVEEWPRTVAGEVENLFHGVESLEFNRALFGSVGAEDNSKNPIAEAFLDDLSGRFRDRNMFRAASVMHKLSVSHSVEIQAEFGEDGEPENGEAPNASHRNVNFFK